MNQFQAIERVEKHLENNKAVEKIFVSTSGIAKNKKEFIFMLDYFEYPWVEISIMIDGYNLESDGFYPELN